MYFHKLKKKYEVVKKNIIKLLLKYSEINKKEDSYYLISKY